jgi:hypothetical protein
MLTSLWNLSGYDLIYCDLLKIKKVDYSAMSFCRICKLNVHLKSSQSCRFSAENSVFHWMDCLCEINDLHSFHTHCNVTDCNIRNSIDNLKNIYFWNKKVYLKHSLKFFTLFPQFPNSMNWKKLYLYKF